jgi:hypothetical protein
MAEKKHVAPRCNRVMIPPVRDIDPDEFADGVCAMIDDWMTSHGYPPMPVGPVYVLDAPEEMPALPAHAHDTPKENG